MLFNNLYKVNDDVAMDWRGFWNELNINYSKIIENDDFDNKLLLPLLEKLSGNDLKDIVLILEKKVEGESEELIKAIMESVDSRALVYLKIFSRRKKKAVEVYYDYKLYNSDKVYSESSALVKLFHLFRLCYTSMFDIDVLQEWQAKGTGYEFKSSKDLNKDIIIDFLKQHQQDKLCKKLSEIPAISTKYKVRMYCGFGNNQGIFMIYKLKNDTQRADFDESKRVKDIEKIILRIDIENSSIHIKSKTISERNQIKEYFEETYECDLKLFEESVFTDYTPDEFKEVFKTLDKCNKPELNNFQVNKITFSTCLLNKTPELIISTPKRDIWPSVVQAYNMKLIDIDSLYSIKNLTITVNSMTRSIRAIHSFDGNIIFKLDDKGLGKDLINDIEKKFMAMFSIPLNRRIKNVLERGKADEIDYILRSNLKNELKDIDKTLTILIKVKIVDVIPVKKYVCTSISCGAETDYTNEILKECPECGNDELVIQTQDVISVNHKVIQEYILRALTSSLDIDIDSIRVSKPKRFNEEYCFYKFICNNKEYQVLITNRIIPRKILINIEKQLIPTIIFYYGIDSEQASLMTPNTIEIVQFGLLFVNEDKTKDFINGLLENLDTRLHYQIVNAALLANEALRKIICEPSKISKKYTSDEFEEDIYALLKDLIFQSEKWGSDERGKPLPEGVLAFAYNKIEGENKVETRHAFTFDCKLTYSDKGYEIGRSEERKALEYVDTINSTSEVNRYCTNSQLSAHIFIGNKFKKSQIENTNKYFSDHIKTGYNTKVVFIRFEAFLKIHDWYRKNFEKIQNNRDIFYENLQELLTTSGKSIDENCLGYLFKELEECFTDERIINIDRIKTKIQHL